MRSTAQVRLYEATTICWLATALSEQPDTQAWCWQQAYTFVVNIQRRGCGGMEDITLVQSIGHSTRI